MTKYIFKFLSYIFWTLMSFLLTVGYMRIILGARPEPTSGLMKMFNWFYGYIFVHVGLIIGSIITVLFILGDIFYFHKKLKNRAHPTIIRLLILISIAIVVGIIHYVLEKVIDII